MTTDFDVVVIGSGFGGAITSCRLAEAGYKVLILERGRRWKVEDYPRRENDAWVWNQKHPEKHNGWLDLRIFPHMAVAQCAGVGGGSLIYANIHVEAKPDLFKQGWPPEITYGELKPYYDKVGKMLQLQKVPIHQWPERTKLVKEGAEKLGYGDRFERLDLAVSFDEDWSYDLEDPHNIKYSKTFINPQGQEQGTCIHLGNCDIGCDVKAKNTLDLNYIPQAEQHGAEVRPLHMVRYIVPVNDGYRVYFERIDAGNLKSGDITARIVIVAAGSLGSTELMLRCHREHKTLPNLSPFLGRNWSSNGDFLTPAFYFNRRPHISPTKGPTIISAIDFLGDKNLDGIHFFIEDGGFPNLPELQGAFLKALQSVLDQHDDPWKHTMPWFAQGRDAADGVFSLRRKWWLFGERKLHLDWNIRESEKTIDAIVEMHEKLAKATGGVPFVPLTWTVSKDLVTPHPLGGCNMGTAMDNGVVNHKGEVFGYKNLYVADAAIIPKAIGANPSKTIAALAERIAKLIVDEDR